MQIFIPVLKTHLSYRDHPDITVHPGAYYGIGSGNIVIDDLQCDGDEVDVAYCKSRPWMSSYCGHHNDVGVDCGKLLSFLNEGVRSKRTRLQHVAAMRNY